MWYAIKLLFKFPWWAYLTIAGGILYQGEQAYQSGVLHEQGVITSAVPGVVSYFVRGQETVLTSDVVADYLRWAIWGFAALFTLIALFTLANRILKRRITATVVTATAVVLVVPFAPSVVPTFNDLVSMASTPAETVAETGNATAVLTSLRPVPRPNTLLAINYPAPEVPLQIVASIGPLPLPQPEFINLPRNIDAPLAAAAVTPAALPSVPPKDSVFVHVSASAAPKPDISAAPPIRIAAPDIETVSVHISTSAAPKSDISAAPPIRIAAPDIEEDLVVAMPSSRNESANWPVIRSGSREAGPSMLATPPITPLRESEFTPPPSPVMRETGAAKPTVVSLAPTLPLHPETDFSVTSVPMTEEKVGIVAPAPPVSELIPDPASEAEPRVVTRSETSFENLIVDAGGQPPKPEASSETPQARFVAMIGTAVLALVLFGVAIVLLWTMKRRAVSGDDRQGLSDAEEARWAKLAQDASAAA